MWSDTQQAELSLCCTGVHWLRLSVESPFLCSPDASDFVFLTVFQASAALARKKGKNLHDDVSIFWHKKKTSEFSVIFLHGL